MFVSFFFISLAFKLLLAFFFTEFLMKNGNYVKKIVNFIFLFSALQNLLFRFKAFFNLLYFLVKENRIFSKADGWSFGWHVNCINKEIQRIVLIFYSSKKSKNCISHFWNVVEYFFSSTSSIVRNFLCCWYISIF